MNVSNFMRALHTGSKAATSSICLKNKHHTPEAPKDSEKFALISYLE